MELVWCFVNVLIGFPYQKKWKKSWGNRREDEDHPARVVGTSGINMLYHEFYSFVTSVNGPTLLMVTRLSCSRHVYGEIDTKS